MAARGGARVQLQLQSNLIGQKFSMEFNERWNELKLGLGWLRAVAQSYNYSYNKIALGSNFQNKLMSFGIT